MELPGVLAATGHRPNKLGGYAPIVHERLVCLAEYVLEQLRPPAVISGMALGWDMAWAQAAVNKQIPFVAAVPFKGQDGAWPQASKDYYQQLLALCAKQIVVCDGEYAAYKMQARNQWMVDNADKVIALWDGTSGGTANCVAYATKKQKEIFNVWHQWLALNN